MVDTDVVDLGANLPLLQTCCLRILRLSRQPLTLSALAQEIGCTPSYAATFTPEGHQALRAHLALQRWLDPFDWGPEAAANGHRAPKPTGKPTAPSVPGPRTVTDGWPAKET
jgi:hypothetical protein